MLGNREERRLYRHMGHQYQDCPVCGTTIDTMDTADLPPFNANGGHYKLEACSEQCAAKRALTDPRFLQLDKMTDQELLDEQMNQAVPPKYRTRRNDVLFDEYWCRQGKPEVGEIVRKVRAQS
jgi:hypothetical protein